MFEVHWAGAMETGGGGGGLLRTASDDAETLYLAGHIGRRSAVLSFVL